ncbi:MAG TPA: RraA family protein [Candidatus Kapabacteria bacterium]|nr:RraA family protein [Candidatus Kapabacteria bacterium]
MSDTTPIDRAILQGMLRFYSPLLSDTMERLGMPCGALHHAIQPTFPDPGLKVCGRAFPCRVVPTPEYVEIHTLLEMVDSIPEDAFVVVAADSPVDAALWGGMMSARARSRGAVAAAVNGGVRDIEQIAALGFPVFGEYRCIKDIRTRGYMAAYDVAVNCGGVEIAPGDLVFGDANGVIAVRRGDVETLYAELERAFTEEAATQRGLVDGGAARSLFDQFGRF